MNKQKINAYLSESLKPWHPMTIVELLPNPNLMTTYILLGCDVNEFIINLIKPVNTGKE